MPIHIEIADELEKLGKHFKASQRTVLLKSVKRALRRSSNPLERLSVKRVQQFRSLNAKLIKQRWFRMKKRLNGMDLRKIEIELLILRKPLNLIDVIIGSKTPRKQLGISVRQRRPLRMRITPGKTVRLNHAFIAKGKKSSVYHVFKRKGPGKSPLVKQAAPSLNELFEKEFFRRPIERDIAKRLNKEFSAAYDYFLAQALR